MARELGHGSTAMAEKVYSHPGAQRHRADVVEYRVEQHSATLGKRLDALDNVTQDMTEFQNDAAA